MLLLPVEVEDKLVEKVAQQFGSNVSRTKWPAQPHAKPDVALAHVIGVDYEMNITGMLETIGSR